MFEDDNFVPTLFNAYRDLQPPLSSKVKKTEKKKLGREKRGLTLGWMKCFKSYEREMRTKNNNVYYYSFFF